MTTEDVLAEFRKAGALREGHFVLSSGLHSPVFLQKNLVFMHAERTERLCAALAEFEDREELWRDLQWTPEAERNTLSGARLRATIRNAPGVLGQACTIIGDAGANILNLRMVHRQSDFFDVDFDVEVRDARHLADIAAALRACPPVETVDRARG